MYTVKAITQTSLCSFINKQGKALRKKYNVTLLKLFFSEDTAKTNEHWQLQKDNHNEKHNKKEQEEEHLHNETHNEHE